MEIQELQLTVEGGWFTRAREITNKQLLTNKSTAKKMKQHTTNTNCIPHVLMSRSTNTNIDAMGILQYNIIFLQFFFIIQLWPEYAIIIFVTISIFYIVMDIFSRSPNLKSAKLCPAKIFIQYSYTTTIIQNSPK